MVTVLFRMAVPTLSLAAAMVVGVAAAARDLPAPDGPVLLRISGAITVTNVGAEAHFDRDMLSALGHADVSTTTIWTEGVSTFSGPRLVDVLEAVGAEGTRITATAMNDYSIEIPVSDAAEGFAILALERDASPMSVREKGPIWVVYPYDSDERFQSEVYYSRSIWQLDRLFVSR